MLSNSLADPGTAGFWACMLLLAVAGWLAWPLLEYGVHGGLAHGMRTPVTPFHWAHHEVPERVFTSPLAWVPATFAMYGALALLVGAGPAAALVLGLLAGFFRYEYLHWRIHFRTPRTARERRRRAHHLAHHERNPCAYYGVTNAFWDRVFGTLPSDAPSDYAAVANVAPLTSGSRFGSLAIRRSR